MRRLHVPERTCAGCGAKRPKRELVRITGTPGVQIDERQRLPGRGAYLCHGESCWRAGVKRGLSRALRMNVPAAVQQELLRAFTMGDRITNG